MSEVRAGSSEVRVTATDELRRLLDERGVEYRVSATGYSIDIGPNMTAYANRTDVTLDVSLRGVTPAQAIDATLGRGTCRDVGKGWMWRCSECKCRLDTDRDDLPTMWVDNVASVPRYCPNCGRKVVE